MPAKSQEREPLVVIPQTDKDRAEAANKIRKALSEWIEKTSNGKPAYQATHIVIARVYDDSSGSVTISASHLGLFLNERAGLGPNKLAALEKACVGLGILK
jgi:hypothetical protein